MTTETKKLDTVTACMIVEGSYEDSTEEEIVEAWQFLYATGIYQSLQGSYSRGIEYMLNQGLIS